MTFNIKKTNLVLFSSLLVVATFGVLADSIVVTPKGTYKCDNVCVVDSHGNVTDCCGGSVWRKETEDPV
ncbi:hypothetical protein ACWXWU_05990 [Shewanella sp. A14]